MSITLHQAAEDLRALLDQVDESTGELPEGVGNASALVQSRAVATVAYVLTSERHADSVEDYARGLLYQVKAERKRAEWLRTYLREHMAATGITKITDERGIFSATLAVGRDVSVDVFDVEQLPGDLVREIPVSYEPDKKAIRSAMDDGFAVPGARLVAKDRLIIR